MKKGTKSQAGIITVIIFILLSFAAFVFIVNFIISLTREKSEDINIEALKIKLDVKNFEVDVSGSVNVKVSRGTGGGKMDSMKMIIYYSDGTTDVKNLNSNMLEELETKDYNLEISPGKRVLKIGAIPFVNGKTGVEIFGKKGSHRDSALIYYWPFEDNTRDYSGNGNHGTSVGTLVFEEGKVGKAYKVNSANTYIYHDISDFSVSSLTIEFWIKPKTVSSGWRDLVGITNNDLSRFHLDFYNNRIVWYYPYDAACYLDTGIIPNANQWYHIAGTHDGATAKVYVNGELKVAKSCGSNTMMTMLTAGSYGEVFDGLIDEVKVYKRTLYEYEIKENYNNPTVPVINTGYGVMGENLY